MHTNNHDINHHHNHNHSHPECHDSQISAHGNMPCHDFHKVFPNYWHQIHDCCHGHEHIYCDDHTHDDIHHDHCHDHCHDHDNCHYEYIKPYSPYDFHGYGCIPCHHGVKPVNVDVNETQKVVEIRNSFGDLRFVVSLASYIHDGTMTSEKYKDKTYLVDVISFCFRHDDPLNILHEMFYDCQEAHKCFNEVVHRYTLIAKSEVNDIQDIGIYADKINYRSVDECCATCKWAKPLEHTDNLFGHHQHMPHMPHDTLMHGIHNHEKCHLHNKFVCMNRELFVNSELNGDKCKHDDFSIEPEVDGNCICDFYEAKGIPPSIPPSKQHCDKHDKPHGHFDSSMKGRIL